MEKNADKIAVRIKVHKTTYGYIDTEISSNELRNIKVRPAKSSANMVKKMAEAAIRSGAEPVWYSDYTDESSEVFAPGEYVEIFEWQMENNRLTRHRKTSYTKRWRFFTC